MNRQRRFFTFLFLLVVTPIFPKHVLFAQDSLRTGVKYGFLPLFSFNSDDGFYLGTEVQQYNYGNQLPFKSYTYARLSYKTNGAYSITIVRDQVKTLGTDIRSSFDFFSTQNFGDYFIGNTEEIEFDRARFDSSGFYHFKSFRINAGAVTRIPLEIGDGISRVDVKTGLRFVYESPWGNEPEDFINSANITGSDGAFLTFIELGMFVERRDSEFRSQSGFSIDFGSKVSPPWVSTHITMENYLYMKGFVPLSQGTFPVTLASRFSFQNTIGNVPYWLMPTLGGSGSIRGFMYRRFSSNNALSYSVEIRSWLLKMPFKNIEFGLTFFADGGRVFANNNWNSILKEHNLALGLGGVMSIFTPDFILKYEMGFSEDGAGVYLGTGYSF